MSRPRKTDSEKLSSVLPPVRCTPEEKDLIGLRAYQAQLSMSAYVRHMALCGKIIVRENDFDLETVSQLRRIGNNLNQQTMRFNTTGTQPQELQGLWQRLNALLDKIMESA